jgi:hypothetical protein
VRTCVLVRLRVFDKLAHEAGPESGCSTSRQAQEEAQMIADLRRKRDAGIIRKSDLPGTLQRRFSGVFDDMTLDEIRAACRGR